MKKSFLYSGLITAIMLGLTLFDYIPSYLFVTISICAFIAALAFSITSTFMNAQDIIKEELSILNDSIQKHFESVNSQLGLLTKETQELKSTADSQYSQGCEMLEKICVICSMLSNIPQRVKEMKEYLDVSLETIKKESETLSSSLEQNTSEMANLLNVINQTNKENKETATAVMSALDKNTSNLRSIVEPVANNLEQNLEGIIEKVASLNSQMDKYVKLSKTLSEGNSKISSNINQTAEKVIESTSSVILENRRLMDDIKDGYSASIDDLRKLLRNIMTEQIETMAEGEKKIGQNVSKLCSTLSTGLQKMEIDIEDLCTSIKEIRTMSQTVEQADKQLLAKILKACN